MPRKSQEARELAVLQNPVEIPRPDAPYDLTDEEVQEWVAIVNRMDAAHFPRETWPLLTSYCRIIVQDRRNEAMIRETLERKPDFNFHLYERLIKIQQANAKALASLATKMRLSQQATNDRDRRQPLMISPPWEKRGG
jgi:hypothetical protein